MHRYDRETKVLGAPARDHVRLLLSTGLCFTKRGITVYRTPSRLRKRLQREDWLLPASDADQGQYSNLAFLEMDEEEIEALGAAIQAELSRRAQ